jgi:tyrosinase
MQLEYQGVRVTSVEVVSDNSPPNTINTFWRQSDVDLSRGMDFAPRGTIFARFTHLQHAPFQYRLNVSLLNLIIFYLSLPMGNRY